jgi:hypothetical protein
MSTGTVSSTGPAFNADTIVAELLNGDGTISLQGQRYNGSGILVAIPEHSIALVPFEFDAAVSAEKISEWVLANASAISSHPAPFYRPRYFGSWVDSDTGILYLDIVEAFPREELTEAIAAGIARNQIAIWDNGRQEEIATNGTGAVD